jgi:hypothetical protein
MFAQNQIVVLHFKVCGIFPKFSCPHVQETKQNGRVQLPVSHHAIFKNYTQKIKEVIQKIVK